MRITYPNDVQPTAQRGQLPPSRQYNWKARLGAAIDRGDLGELHHLSAIAPRTVAREAMAEISRLQTGSDYEQAGPVGLGLDELRPGRAGPVRGEPQPKRSRKGLLAKAPPWRGIPAMSPAHVGPPTQLPMLSDPTVARVLAAQQRAVPVVAQHGLGVAGAGRRGKSLRRNRDK